jgi:hypothetical protein
LDGLCHGIWVVCRICSAPPSFNLHDLRLPRKMKSMDPCLNQVHILEGRTTTDKKGINLKTSPRLLRKSHKREVQDHFKSCVRRRRPAATYKLPKHLLQVDDRSARWVVCASVPPLRALTSMTSVCPENEIDGVLFQHLTPHALRTWSRIVPTFRKTIHNQAGKVNSPTYLFNLRE